MKLRSVSVVLIVILAAGAARGARRRAVATVPTFSREVVRILQANCQSCHTEGGIAPFSLRTYAEVAPKAAMLALMVASGRMPPWKPAQGCGEFLGERRLSPGDVNTLLRWVAAGAPEGERLDLPEPYRLDDQGWRLGTPDIRLQSDELYQAPFMRDSFRCFVFRVPAEKNVYLSAIDFRSLARGNVHHMIAYIDHTGVSESLDQADPGPGYGTDTGPGFSGYGILGAWFPGAAPLELPEGVAIELPAGARVVLQVHYHPHDGMIAPDRSEIALYLARTPVRKLLRYLNVESRDFTIPANDPAFHITGRWEVPRGMTVYAAGLHAHFLARAMSLEAINPDGARRCLIRIADYDWKWQGMYRYREPVAIPAGTTLEVNARYDNSAANPENPNVPARDVHWGEYAHNEMCIGYLAFTWDDEDVP